MVRIQFRLMMLAALLAAALTASPLPATAQIPLRPAGGRAGRARCRDADFVGGPQPLPAVPGGARLPAPCRRRPRPQRSGHRTGAGAAERRPRLGPQHGEPALHRSVGPRQRALHPRRRQGKLPDAVGAPGHGPADRTGSGRRHLRLDARRRRRPPAIHLRLRRAGQFPGALRPADGRHRGRLVRPRRAAAGLHRDRGARYLHRRARRQHRVGRRQSGPADRAGGRGVLLPLLSRDGLHAILPPEPRRLQGRPGLRSARQPAGVAAPERAVAQFGLPSLAVQLPDPHRAGARRAVSAHRGDLSAAGLHRRHHRRGAVRLAAGARMPADQIGRQMLRQGSARSSPNCARPSPPPSAASPTAGSTWCCCRSAPTTSIFPGWSPT